MTTASVNDASPVPSRLPEQLFVKSAHAEPRPTAIVPSVCSATLASSRHPIRNAKRAHWVRSRHVSVLASVTNVRLEHRPTLQPADASCAMPVSSRLEWVDANDVPMVRSAELLVLINATAAVVARRPMPLAPSASSVNRVRSLLMRANAKNAQSPKFRRAPVHVHAIRADLHRSLIPATLVARCAQPVRTRTTTVSARHASPVPSRELVQRLVKSVHAAPRPTVLVPSVCSATQASSPMPTRNAKPAHWVRFPHVSVHASVTIAP
jgi:hypothetical protein